MNKSNNKPYLPIVNVKIGVLCNLLSNFNCLVRCLLHQGTRGEMFKVEVDCLATTTDNGDWVALMEAKTTQVDTVQLFGRFTHYDGYLGKDVVTFAWWRVS